MNELIAFEKFNRLMMYIAAGPLLLILPVAVFRKKRKLQMNIYIVANVLMSSVLIIRIIMIDWGLEGVSEYVNVQRGQFYFIQTALSVLAYIAYYYYVCCDKHGKLNYRPGAAIAVIGLAISSVVYQIALFFYPYMYMKNVTMILQIGFVILFIGLTRKERDNTAARIICLSIPMLGEVIGIIRPGIEISYPCFGLSLALLYLTYQMELENEMIKNELELSNNKVKVLLSQIQPHFIFNSLEVIRQVCSEDPERAEECIARFSKYLRHNLDSLSEEDMIPFDKELNHIRQYIELELAKKAVNMEVIWDLQEKDFQIPSLTVEPLVENAIRHGIATKKGGGTVKISSFEKKDSYVISVEDNGIGINNITEKQKEHKSTGIENVRKRLYALCDGELKIEGTENGTIATITIEKTKKKIL